MGRAPRYQLIADDLAQRIHSGQIPADSQLPSESDLAIRYNVSRMTVRQALNQLEAARLVQRRRGAGSFVLGRAHQTRDLLTLRPFAEEFADRNAVVDSIVVVAEERDDIPAEVESALCRGKSQRCVHIVRVRRVDGVAAAYQDAWIPFSVAPSLALEPLVEQSLYRTLRVRYGVELAWADQVISPATAVGEMASLLQVDSGSSLIKIERLTYSSRNAPVEYVNSWTTPQFPLAMRLDAARLG